MIVMKFGGTSVANSNMIGRVIDIIRSKVEKWPIVVVSAMSKVTDMLYGIADAASRQDKAQMEGLLTALRERHLAECEAFFTDSTYLAEAQSRVSYLCDELAAFAEAVCALGELSDRSKAIIISYGEYLSSNIIACAMNASGIRTTLMDSRKMIITNDENLKAEPIFEQINARVPSEVNKAFSGVDAVITQGFVAASIDGEPTVLGRGGSDYTASLLAMASGAEEIEIWTDVDGVYSSDPRTVKGTRPIPVISFEEAAELAHFGAKVLHPLTIEPAVIKNIPIKVLNTMNPKGSGTTICEDYLVGDGVKSVTFKDNILVINIYSLNMSGTVGFLKKVFSVFNEYKVSIDLVATTEVNISVTLDKSQKGIAQAIKALGEFSQVTTEEDKAQVSVIGKNISAIKGMLRSIFTPVDDEKVYMISHGASDINVSFVVDREKAVPTVQAVHSLLFN